MASVMSPSNAAALGGVAGDRAGVGSAVVQTSRQVGGSVGIAVMGAIVAQGIAGRQTPEAFVHGFSNALTVASLIAFAGALVAVTLVRSRPRPGKGSRLRPRLDARGSASADAALEDPGRDNRHDPSNQ